MYARHVANTPQISRNPWNIKASNTLVQALTPIPFPRARSSLPPLLLPIITMSADLYDILGVQRDATEDQGMSSLILGLVQPSSCCDPRSPKSV